MMARYFINLWHLPLFPQKDKVFEGQIWLFTYILHVCPITEMQVLKLQGNQLHKNKHALNIPSKDMFRCIQNI